MRLADRVAVIMGGSSGIGEAAAVLFAREGAAVVVVGSDEWKAERVAEAIRGNGRSALGLSADVSIAADVERVMSRAVDEFGGIDVLFNNVGRPERRPFDVSELPEEEWDRVLDVSLKSAFLGCKYAVPAMRRRGAGSIINTSATAGLLGNRHRAAYCAAKGGLVAMTRAIANDCVEYNIRVNAIAPGPTETPMFRAYINAQPDPERAFAARSRHVPLGRPNTADEVAYAALYLASDESSSVTGVCIPVDGGLSSFTSLHKV